MLGVALLAGHDGDAHGALPVQGEAEPVGGRAGAEAGESGEDAEGEGRARVAEREEQEEEHRARSTTYARLRAPAVTPRVAA